MFVDIESNTFIASQDMDVCELPNTISGIQTWILWEKTNKQQKKNLNCSDSTSPHHKFFPWKP